MEGDLAPTSCFYDDSSGERVLCSHEDETQGCATRVLWLRVQGGVSQALSRTTLDELVAFAERGPVETKPAAGAELPLHDAA